MNYRHLPGLCIMILSAVGLVAGCSSNSSLAPVFNRLRPVPDSYVVVSGDTLSSIAWRYELDYRQIASWNNLSSPNLIYPGQRLWLRPPVTGTVLAGTRSTASTKPLANGYSGLNPGPGGSQSGVRSPLETMPRQPIGSSEPLLIVPQSQSGELETASVPQRTVGDRVWRWPTLGNVVRDYEPDVPGGKGIKISGELGQMVWAASPGQVVYSGSGLPGYGRLIILRHSDKLLSAYGYLGKIFVEEGDNVHVGQSIAELGTSNESRPVLHFEIRRDGKPVNPLDFLPS